MQLSLSSIPLILCFISTVSTQDSTFERPDFNIAQVLIGYGVNVAILPGLDSLLAGPSTSACPIACGWLQILFGSAAVSQQSKSTYPTSTWSFWQSNSTYSASTAGYWSVQQASVEPFCFFRPATNVEVAIAILISRLSQCPFAAKSGGHAAFAGSSSIEGGIAILLEKLKAVELSKNQTTVDVGPGNTWYDVYTSLQPLDVAVIGGRVSGIGVGGLTTGGGISFFSNIYGWACDNVASYEVVTASGPIITASPSQFSDLYWALRGGGNNFGIVTKFTLNAFPLPGGQMWGGSRFYLSTEFEALVDAFYNLGVNSPSDPNAAQILSFAYDQPANLTVGVADIEYAKPVANASIFNEYLGIPAISDTLRISTLANLTQELNSSNPDGLRESYWTSTFRLNRTLVASVRDIFLREIQPIANAAGLVAAMSLQVITEGQLVGMSKRGGNPLGLSAAGGPYLLINLSTRWANASDDARIFEVNQRIVSRTVALAQSLGLYEEYLYMNYASQYQDVIASYGSRNKALLKGISAKYDPKQVFQLLEPGYFKLDGPPVSSGH